MNDEQPQDVTRILGKIRACFARGAESSGASENERETALRQGHALLTKYNLSMAQVEASSGKVEDAKRGSTKVKSMGEAYAATIGMAVADLFFCRYLIDGADKKFHYFIGRESNRETASLMFVFLVESIVSEGKARARIEGYPLDKYLRNFAKGAANIIFHRCRALREEAEKANAKPSSSTAIVLASYYESEKRENAVMITSLFVAVGKSSGGRGITGAGYSEGVNFGKNISLNRQVAGGATAAKRVGVK